jgi:hypothetical protein
MTVGSPPSRTAMHEFVVPRSMPIVFAMSLSVSFGLNSENLSAFIADLGQPLA